MNHEQIQNLVQSLLRNIGEDPTREGLRDTPRRVAVAYEKIFGGYNHNPKDLITLFDNEGYNEMVVAKQIDFYSTCEHHLLPFYGVVHIGYIPDNKIIGLSKLPRLVELFSRRLQNQERLTKQITDTLQTLVRPKGVGVVIEAEHLCVKVRGVEKQNCKVLTSSFAGSMATDSKIKHEFLDLIR